MRVKKFFACLFGFPLFYPRWLQMPAYTTTVERKVKKSFTSSFVSHISPFSELAFLGMATRARLGGQHRETAAAGTVTIDAEKKEQKKSESIICTFFVLASATIQRIAMCIEQRQKENYGLQHLL